MSPNPPQPPSRAWKFLDERGRGMVTGFTWPVPDGAGEPGPWVESGGPLEACRHGIHACRIEDLAWWLSAQLWEVELDGDRLADVTTVVAERGRLVRRVEGWPGVGAEMADWAVWRSCRHARGVLRTAGARGDAEVLERCADLTELARVASRLARQSGEGDPVPVAERPAGRLALDLLVDNLTDLPNPVTACHTSARSAGHAGSTDGGPDAYELAFAAERRAQGQWLARRLDLPT